MKRHITFFLAITLFFSCQKNTESGKYSSSKRESLATSSSTSPQLIEERFEVTPPESGSIEDPNDVPEKKGTKIMKIGKLQIEVEDLFVAKHQIDTIVENRDAYYEKELLRNSDYRQKYSLTIRIPSAKFEDMIHAIESGDGEILEKNINAKDVTEEYLDLEIRLDNNKAYLKRYTELLKKAQSIKDMLEIQEKIRKIELLVDSNIGRMRYLNDRVAYSVLNIELTKKPEEEIAAAPPTFFDDVKGAFKNGYSGILIFILILTNIWPIILLVLILVLFRNRIFGFLNKKKGFTVNKTNS